jgi:Ca2+-transporting ATPase
MMDPPREEAKRAVAACHDAGITVKMITGDHIGTASAIGEQIGIITPAGAMRGAEVEAAGDEELARRIGDTNVFARVAPEHKLRIVKALQAGDDVVAMTGDGVNDAPALKQANIGVAMGITGTAVSKESADIILTDDNFASIAAAVEEGRRVYDNLLKSLAFVLPTNLGLAFILMWAVSFFPFEVTGGEVSLLLPMTPAQLLWINLVATVALALPLAFEAAERDVMQRPPRDPGAPVLTPFVIRRTVLTALLMTVGAVGMYHLAHDWADAAGLAEQLARAEAQTMAVTTVIAFEIFYLWHSRSFRASLRDTGLFTNRTVFLGIPALLVLQAGFIYVPFMNVVFDSAPLSGLELLAAAGVGALILPIISAEKWIARRTRRG